MQKETSKKCLVTTMIGTGLCAGAVMILKIREKKINREIDEFDRIMREMKERK